MINRNSFIGESIFYDILIFCKKALSMNEKVCRQNKIAFHPYESENTLYCKSMIIIYTIKILLAIEVFVDVVYH